MVETFKRDFRNLENIKDRKKGSKKIAREWIEYLSNIPRELEFFIREEDRTVLLTALLLYEREG